MDKQQLQNIVDTTEESLRWLSTMPKCLQRDYIELTLKIELRKAKANLLNWDKDPYEQVAAKVTEQQDVQEAKGATVKTPYRGYIYTSRDAAEAKRVEIEQKLVYTEPTDCES